MRTLGTVISFIGALFIGSGSLLAEENTVFEFVPEQAEVSPVEQELGEGNPWFVMSPLYPSGKAIVLGVAEANTQDVVLLDNGYDQGFRHGMHCEVVRQKNIVGEIVLVDVRVDRAAGLILSLNENATIQSNDLVRIKTVQFNN